MQLDETKLKDLLLDSGLVSKADLQKIIEDAKKKGVPFTELLLSLGKIDVDELDRIEA